MLGILQFHLFVLVVWWWLRYRWWKYNFRFRRDIVPVGLNDEDVLYNLFDTGDIILNRGEYRVWNHPMYYYALYCSISNTIFTHVGIIVKDHVKKKLYVVHCSPRFRSLNDFVGSHAMPHAFVVHDLRWYIHRYHGTTMVRRVERNGFFARQSEALTNIAFGVQQEYQQNNYRFVRIDTIVRRFIGTYHPGESTEVHCAEFAGIVLKRLGLLSNVEEWDLYPDSFSVEKNPSLPGYENKYFHIRQDMNFGLIKNKVLWWTKKVH